MARHNQGREIDIDFQILPAGDADQFLAQEIEYGYTTNFNASPPRSNCQISKSGAAVG
jgi:hypothetical protein